MRSARLLLEGTLEEAVDPELDRIVGALLAAGVRSFDFDLRRITAVLEGGPELLDRVAGRLRDVGAKVSIWWHPNGGVREALDGIDAEFYDAFTPGGGYSMPYFFLWPNRGTCEVHGPYEK